MHTHVAPTAPLDAQVPLPTAFDIGRSLRNGVGVIRRNFWVYLIGGFLKAILEGGLGPTSTTESSRDDGVPLPGGADDVGAHIGLLPPLPTSWFQDDVMADVASMTAALQAAMLVGVAVGFVLIALGAVLVSGFVAGWIRMHARAARTGTTSLSELFDVRDVLAASVGWTALAGVAVAIGLVVATAATPLTFLVPSEHMLVAVTVSGAWAFGVVLIALYVWTCLAFVRHAIALEGLGVWAAIHRSLALTRGGRAWLLFYMGAMAFITYLGGLAGLLLCVVGVLVTAPLRVGVRDYGFTEGFLRLTRPPEEVAGYACQRSG